MLQIVYLSFDFFLCINLMCCGGVGFGVVGGFFCLGWFFFFGNVEVLFGKIFFTIKNQNYHKNYCKSSLTF